MIPVRDNFASPIDLRAVSALQSSTSEPPLSEGAGASMVRTCLPCRRKHAKCDGMTPCSRCKKNTAECVYVARRRKSRSVQRTTAPSHSKQSAKTPSCCQPEASPMMAMSGLSLNAARQFEPRDDDTSWDLSAPINIEIINRNPFDVLQRSGRALQDQPDPYVISDDYLDSFYLNFHSSHPFILPKAELLRMAKRQQLGHLFAVMRWIGSLYLRLRQTESASNLFEDAYRLTYDPIYPKNGFIVQAMMLLVIGLDGIWQQESAKKVLANAEKIALDISLNTEAFARDNGEGRSVVEESWRRTWWDLFVLDGIFAGVHRSTNFPLFDAPSDVAIPCEEFQYLSGDIPKSASLSSLDDQEFSDTGTPISSFGYRILAIRILGRLIQVRHIYDCDDANIARLESLLTNWRLHLPDRKSQCLQDDGSADEMMFQGFMTFHLTTILLHFPHSQIKSVPNPTITSCAPRFNLNGTGAFNLHTQHAIQSAGEISKMITYPVSLLAHSPFFCCVLALSSIVHLGKVVSLVSSHDIDHTRQQILLNLGALAEIGRVWKTARESELQLKAIIGELQ